MKIFTDKIKVVIPICDDNLYILPILYRMYMKYWKTNQYEYHILGFKTPDFKFNEKNWFFHSLDSTQQGGSQTWSKYIAKYLKSITDEYIIFGLEDFIPTDYINRNIISKVFDKMTFRKEVIDRFELGFDIYTAVEHDVIENFVFYNILKAKQNAMYRISTQTSIWRREFLIKYMDREWTPWQFEVDGSTMSFYDTKACIVSCGDIEWKHFPAKWIHKGMISRQQPGKFNVLGLKLYDIKELCDKNLLNQNDLIFGMWPGYVPTFNELGGFDNFDFEKFRNIESIKQYTNHNWKEYENVYR